VSVFVKRTAWTAICYVVRYRKRMLWKEDLIW